MVSPTKYHRGRNHNKLCFLSIKSTLNIFAFLAVLGIFATNYILLHQASDLALVQKFSYLDADANANINENTDLDQNQKRMAKATVAYMISLTHCSPLKSDSKQQLHDGAAVLKHSIHLNSFENYDGQSHSSLYSYKMFAIVHPIAESCSKPLADLGYEIWIRETPINVEDIKTEFLRTKVVTNGCCGEKEYNKLWAYTVNPEEHPIAVHLDIDTLVVQPLDDLFDAMLLNDADNNSAATHQRIPVMFDEDLPVSNEIQAFFTRDYNMVQPGRKHVGVQGGFIVLRPSMESFEEYRSIIIEGKFFSGSGWGGLGFGGFFGGMTFQGIVPYFYDHRHPGTAVELNRCIYNAMADNPRVDVTIKADPRKPGFGVCRDGRSECEDCRETNIKDVKTIHYTLCQKPWTCLTFENVGPRSICNKYHHEWFKIRKDLDDKNASSLATTEKGSFYPEHFMGYCKGRGERNYIPMQFNS